MSGPPREISAADSLDDSQSIRPEIYLIEINSRQKCWK